MKSLKLLFLFALLFFSTTIFAQSGTLDPTFDGDGIVTTNASNTTSVEGGIAAVVQPDGKILVAGVSDGRFTVVRYNSDWSLDLSFNTYGVIFPYIGTANSIILQPDGKIIVAGVQYAAYYIIRLNIDGSFDTTFSSDGRIRLPIYAGVGTTVRSLALTTDGKIMVAGHNGGATASNFILYRLSNDGSLDTTFDTDGIAVTDFSSDADLAYSIIIQPDNKIILAGQAKIAGNVDFALARYNTDGSLDTTFGGTGKVTTSIGTGIDIIKAIDLQTDGKIVVSGYMVNSSINYIAVARYNTNGSLDTSFDTDGKATFVAGTSSGIKVLSDGKILVNSTANADYSVAKLNTNGSLDISFGTNGYGTHNIGSDASNFMCIKSDDTIFIGGTSDNLISLVQFSVTGNLISFFQSPGISFINNLIEKVVLQSDGKTLVAGITDNDRIALVRYNVDGSFDSGFGINGILITNQTSGNGGNDTELFLQQDMKIVVVTSNGFMYRYLADGTTDTTFGVNGVSDLTASIIYLDNAILAADGKFYLAIDYNFNTESQIALLRINNDGSIDTTFGINGFAYTRFIFYASDDYEFPRELVELPNGKILVAGYGYPPSDSSKAIIGIARFNSDGILDTTFGTNGKVILNIGTLNYSYDLTLQTDGKFIMSVGIDNSTRTIRYNYDGSVDTTFGTGGILTDAAVGSSFLLLQSDGKLLRGGGFGNQFGIARYNIDGSIDNSFGTNGVITTAIGVSSFINSLALSQDGKLVAAGRSFNGYNNIFAIARYTDLNLGNLDFTISKKSMFIYPNPIEEETNLTYKLTQTTTVSIALYDIQGKLVKTYLHNQFQNPDDYYQKITMPAGLRTGNYILKVDTPEGSISIKLLKK